MLKIFDNYYLDASSVCYVLKKAHVKGDGKLEYDVCTYHTRLEEALAEAVRRGLREGVASGELTEWEQLCGELRRLKSEGFGKRVKRFLAGLFLDDVKSIIHDLLSNTLFAVEHHAVDELRHQNAVVHRIRQNFSFGNVTSSGHYTSLLH